MNHHPAPAPRPESPVRVALGSALSRQTRRSRPRRNPLLHWMWVGSAMLWSGNILAQEPASPPPPPAQAAAEPSLVSLHLNNTPMSLAIKELTKQTGFEIAISRDFSDAREEKEERKITLDIDQQPFWEVIRQFCVQSGWKPVECDFEGRCLTLARGGGGWIKRPLNMEGQFMVMAASVQRNQELRLGDPHGAYRSFAVAVDIFADPKFKIVGWKHLIDVEVATDDKGNSLVVKEGKSHQNFSFPGGRLSPLLRGLQAPLRIRPDVGKKLAELKGVARLSVQTKSQPWDLGDPLKINKEQQRVVNDKVTLTIKSVAPAAHDPTALEVKLVIAIKRKPSLNLFGRRDDDSDPLTRASFLQGCLTVVDAKGRPFQRGGQSGNGNGNAWEYDITFSPPDDGNGAEIVKPAKMIWDVPLEIKEVAVPVEFKDLPLP